MTVFIPSVIMVPDNRFSENNMKKLLSVIPAIALAILITGCGYKPGTVKNEVYTNKTFGITITPPEGMIFKEVPTECADYMVAYSYCILQGEQDSFEAEYAIESIPGGLIVVSEDNPGDFTADKFVENVQAQQNEKLFFTYKTIIDKDVTINGVSFRQLTFDSDGNHQTFLIKVYPDRILFIYISTSKAGVDSGLEEELINSVSSIQ